MVGDERLLEATGRSREDWFALLDAEAATGWGHTRIATFLREEHGVDAWWSQGVTVAYEQARGLRQPGQQSDGTFAASSSKTLPVDRDTLRPWLTEPARIARWAGNDVERVSADGAKTTKLATPDGRRVAIYVDDAPAKDGLARVKVAVQAEKLAGPEAVADAKARWKAALGELARLI